MRFLDDFLNAMTGPKVVEISLEAGEMIRLDKAAGLLVGGKSLVGGRLVLTDARLLFQPWDVKAIGTLLAQGLTKAGATGIVGTAVGKLAAVASTPREESLEAITSAWPSRDESLLSPPGLAIRLSDGRSFEFGILKDKLSPNFLIKRTEGIATRCWRPRSDRCRSSGG